MSAGGERGGLSDGEREELHGHVVGCDTDALIDTVERILAEARTAPPTSGTEESGLRAAVEALCEDAVYADFGKPPKAEVVPGVRESELRAALADHAAEGES